MTMAHPKTYTITGSPDLSRDLSPERSIPAHNPTDTGFGNNGLGILYHRSASSTAQTSPRSQNHASIRCASTPTMPPTPPHLERGKLHNDVDVALAPTENAMTRLLLMTPVNQQSPPTPDLTPPRPLYSLLGSRPGTQLSMASTRAESFRTAREDFNSEAGSTISLLRHGHYETGYRQFPLTKSREHACEHKGSSNSNPTSSMPPQTQFIVQTDQANIPKSDVRAFENSANHSRNALEVSHEDSPTLPQGMFRFSGPAQGISSEHTTRVPNRISDDPQPIDEYHAKLGLASPYATNHEAHSTHQSLKSERLASIIGWDDGAQSQKMRHKRHASVSTTSTVDALVVRSERLGRSKGTLRHMLKTESLRSVSMPLNMADNGALPETSDSFRRLHHKTVKLSNTNRSSFGSETSPSHKVSTGSYRPNIEVIKVAVVPDRVSSLSLTDPDYRRSRAYSLASDSDSGNRLINSQSSKGRHRISDSSDKERIRYYPPQAPPFVPVRRSSISATTSQTASYANSVASDGLGVERRKAEKDLRSTLERMETGRRTSELGILLAQSDITGAGSKQAQQSPSPEPDRRGSVEYHHMTTTSPHNRSLHGRRFSEQICASSLASSFSDHSPFNLPIGVASLYAATPGTREWAALRPTSTLETPFSQPSFLSSSPEINEAKVVNLFPHNNHSVQLINPQHLQDPWALQHVSLRQTPAMKTLPDRYVVSPLRHPRRPPQPPPPIRDVLPMMHAATQLKDIPSSTDDQLIGRRPSLGTEVRVDSFGKSLVKVVSLKNMLNKKAKQDLDPELNPFWRPRAFWNDTEQNTTDGFGGAREIVQNSLGLSTRDHQGNGRVGLMHRISERRRRKVAMAKQASYTSLRMIKAGKRMYRIPGFGLQIQFVNLKEIRKSLADARYKRQSEKWEKKHMELRKSIGAPLIPTVDSRFPAGTERSD